MLFTFAVIAIAVVIVIFTTRPATSLKTAGIQANQLITSAGGPAKICDEASQMFKRFGISKERFLSASDLKDYPAIAALGESHVILPDNPPRMSIRVGTHLNGYFIEIADTNSPIKYIQSSNTLELVKSCIFVHR